MTKRSVPTDYEIPHLLRLERGPSTEKLYQHEHAAVEAIKRATSELLAVLGEAQQPAAGAARRFWMRGLPLELFTILESFDADASIAAAVGFLEYQRSRHGADRVAKAEARARAPQVTTHPGGVTDADLLAVDEASEGDS
jgi:hypothetical protein